MKFLWRSWHVMAAAAAGLLFLYAGGVKFLDLARFADGVRSFLLVPERFVPVVAAGVPLVECMSGLAALVPAFRRVGVLSLLMLTLVFMAAIVVALARGISPECGCFGVIDGMSASPWALLLRDAALAAILVAVYVRLLRLDSLASWEGGN